MAPAGMKPMGAIMGAMLPGGPPIIAPGAPTAPSIGIGIGIMPPGPIMGICMPR